MNETRRDVNSLSRRAAGSTTRWKSTARQQLWRGSCGEEPTRLVFLSFCTLIKTSAPCIWWMCPCMIYMYISAYSIKYVYPQDSGEYVQFLRKSHADALKEEERRHRFLAEKHCGLIQSIAHLMNKVHGWSQREFVNSIFDGLLTAGATRVWFVLQLVAINVRRTKPEGTLKREFMIMCNDYVRLIKSP